MDKQICFSVTTYLKFEAYFSENERDSKFVVLKKYYLAVNLFYKEIALWVFAVI